MASTSGEERVRFSHLVALVTDVHRRDDERTVRVRIAVVEDRHEGGGRAAFSAAVVPRTFAVACAGRRSRLARPERTAPQRHATLDRPPPRCEDPRGSPHLPSIGGPMPTLTLLLLATSVLPADDKPPE